MRYVRLLFVLAAFLMPGISLAHPLIMLQYHHGLENTITCPAGFWCSVSLDRGERISSGFISHIPEWAPRNSYSGDSNPRPYLLFHPMTPGLRSDIVLITNRRSYYFLLVSDASKEPAHYAMTYPDDLRAFREAQHTVAAAHTTEAPDPKNCIDDRYGIDRLRVFFYPTHVCNDGQHTFIMLRQFRETPSDLPVLFTIVDGNTAMVNYIFDASHFRYVVDGVPDMMVLVSGTGKHKTTMRVQHLPMPILSEKTR